MSKRAWSTLLIVLAATGCAGAGDGVASAPSPAPAPAPAPSSTSAPGTVATSGSPRASTAAVTTIATELDVPWGLAFLPDGSALVTLRDQAEVRHVSEAAMPVSVSVGRVPGVVPGEEGGLLGIAVSPKFAADRTVFVYFTSANDNRVMRMTFDGTTLRPGPIIVNGIPKGAIHDGGRLAFGPDGFLYISTGEAGLRDPAQDMGSLSGKILRVTAEGAPAPGNPFPGSRIWTLGHRNVQGLAWDKTGAMYASELGQNTWDELNLIERGRNYGWPIVEGIAHRPGFVDPLRQWTTAEASPSGIAVGTDGAIYMAALRGESLWRIPLSRPGQTGTPERLLQEKYGRLRTVVSAPDGRLWLVSNNTFRGATRPGDDRIVALRLPVQP
jgi:glucose/arabinose dehydrogenase